MLRTMAHARDGDIVVEVRNILDTSIEQLRDAVKRLDKDPKGMSHIGMLMVLIDYLMLVKSFASADSAHVIHLKLMEMADRELARRHELEMRKLEIVMAAAKENNGTKEVPYGMATSNSYRLGPEINTFDEKLVVRTIEKKELVVQNRTDRVLRRVNEKVIVENSDCVWLAEKEVERQNLQQSSTCVPQSVETSELSDLEEIVDSVPLLFEEVRRQDVLEAVEDEESPSELLDIINGVIEAVESVKKLQVSKQEEERHENMRASTYEETVEVKIDQTFSEKEAKEPALVVGKSSFDSRSKMFPNSDLSLSIAADFMAFDVSIFVVGSWWFKVDDNFDQGPMQFMDQRKAWLRWCVALHKYSWNIWIWTELEMWPHVLSRIRDV